MRPRFHCSVARKGGGREGGGLGGRGGGGKRYPDDGPRDPSIVAQPRERRHGRKINQAVTGVVD